MVNVHIISQTTNVPSGLGETPLRKAHTDVEGFRILESLAMA